MDVFIACQLPIGMFRVITSVKLSSLLGHGNGDYTEEYLGDVGLLGK